MSGAITLTSAGGVGQVVLNRPPLNVLDHATLDELAGALHQVRRDRSVRVLAISGAGKAFCAGADVGDHLPGRVERMLPAFSAVLGALADVEVPTVALVHGTALGGGMELALACDVVLCSEAAKLGQPETQLGVFPPAAAVLLPRLVGRQRALDLILTGRTISAREALELGIVTRVWPADSFVREAEQYLAALAALSSPALRLAKRAVDGAAGLAHRPALKFAERVYLDELMRHSDPEEGLTAFLEKRAPVWSHS
ncbi:MAG TPA: enoyl-CoA hydratase-related protein [Gemmatimonadales bacterium]|nr:enoyl-CoA hydratase-related protein [Gemmatimonadales bacterium]